MGKGGKYTIIPEKDEDGNIIAEVAGLQGCHSWGEDEERGFKEHPGGLGIVS